jgi:hypothetical protein
VVTAASPEALTAQLRSREEETLRLADPTAVLAAPEIRATREAYKALGKDPARYRGSAEALLRRIVAGSPLHMLRSFWANSRVCLRETSQPARSLPNRAPQTLSAQSLDRSALEAVNLLSQEAG